MRVSGRLGSGAALWLLLAAQAVAAFEPISVGIAIGAASVITGYLSYRDLYCRFAECCRKQRPLNATGRRLGGWAAGRGGARGPGPEAGEAEGGGASIGTAALGAAPPVDVGSVHGVRILTIAFGTNRQFPPA